MSTCHFVRFTLCKLGVSSICHFANFSVFQLTILSFQHFMNLPFCQLGSLSTSYYVNAILSVCSLVNLPFCQFVLLSNCHFVSSPVFSTCHFINFDSVFLPLCLLAIYVSLPSYWLTTLSACPFVNSTSCLLVFSMLLKMPLFMQLSLVLKYQQDWLLPLHFTKLVCIVIISLRFCCHWLFGRLARFHLLVTLPTCHFINLQLFQLAILSTCHFANLFFQCTCLHNLALSPRITQLSSNPFTWQSNRSLS